jgi:peptidoglycan/xylan/chitin deacetylase (PgdA/CDA1 family)
LTFDFDAMSLWIGAFDSKSPSMVSRGEFGARAIPRLLGLLKRYNVKATFCIVGHTALAYPDLIRQIRDDGHEIVAHSWCHENPQKFDREGEKRDLERTLEAIEKVAGVRPKGYRSPAWDFSENTVELLRQAGMEYDSSLMGSDFYPYYVRHGDTWSTEEPYHFGEVTDLVEIPVTWGLDDFPPFEFVWGQNTGLSAPSAMEEIWKGDFDYAYRACPGGIYNMTMHPQVSGRGHRMLLLERLISHFKTHDGVVYEGIGDYVKRWKTANPIEKWKADNRIYTGGG